MLTIGRVRLRRGATTMERDGDQLSLAGRIQNPSGLEAGDEKYTSLWLARFQCHQIVGLADGSDPYVAVTYTLDPHVDGIYRVAGSKVSYPDDLDRVDHGWQVDLERVQAHAAPLLDLAPEHDRRSGSPISAGSCQPRIGFPDQWPEAHGSDVSSSATTESEDGSVFVGWWADDDDAQEIQVRPLPASFYDAAATILLGPPLAIFDSFTRSDSATDPGDAETGQAWQVVQGTGDGDVGISSNQLYASAVDSAYQVVVHDGIPNGFVEATIDTTGATGSLGLVYRFDGGSFNGFSLALLTGAWNLYRLDGGTPTSVVSGTYTEDATISLRVTFEGDVHTVYIDGQQVGQGVDATYANQPGKAGVNLNNTTSRIDDFAFGRDPQAVRGDYDAQLAAYQPLVGLQVPGGEWGWCLTNGITRVYPPFFFDESTLPLVTQRWEPSADDWTSPKRYEITGTSPGPESIIASPTVNTPDRVGLRIVDNSINETDLALNRGAAVVECRVDPDDATSTAGVARDTTEAATGITGGIVATSADADGGKYVLLSAALTTKDTTNGALTRSGADPFDFGLGYETSGAVAPDRETDQAAQYMAPTATHPEVVAP